MDQLSTEMSFKSKEFDYVIIVVTKVSSIIVYNSQLNTLFDTET